ncbi:NACHT domain-containing protein [Streptomyces sp. B6B3]|uniref:NACHT domain-containing protein n=1 Tax=Streptomyces sp. B6B3 TaxID=3153570 RepID=UPI00325CD2A5
MEMGGIGLRLASSAVVPLVKRLFRPEGPGAGLVDRPVRISALVTFRGEQRTLSDDDLRRLSTELVARAVRAAGPHDAPGTEEQREVADALAASFGTLGTLTMDDVQAVRLGAWGLAERLVYPAHLSAAADALYQSLLHSVCVHILNFFTQRSTFVARTLVEQTRQLDELVRRVDLLVERVPPLSAADTTFEGRYARYVLNRHSQLTIYGVDLHAAREWPLNAAYLTLQATEREPNVHAGADPDAPRGAPQPEPAERALAGRERVLLRGEAGSGKTTLVQWLAITTARQDTLDGGQTHLLGRVPFVLPLRTLTRGGRELPAPDAFLSAVSCPIAGAQPTGWPDRVLAAGRGVLLIDGIDEIPEPEREPARRWLRELLAAYPGNPCLVTARPSAVRDDWLARDGFAELSLARMGGDDVAAFVHRWHRAAGVSDAEGPDETALLDAIRTKPDLGRLATNPLMCGLICALHRERRGYLPRGRKALYDAALLMLLERRDRERGVDPGDLELDAEAQTLLLQKLAYWLIRNGRAELDQEVAHDLLARVLPSMRFVADQGTPAAVLRHLVERSGLLREPGPGAVEFVHRTFQDYLGALEAVEERDLPLLVDNAHLDQWEDVIRMAVAHARPDERASLLTALVERGDRHAKHRVRLHLLAMACLEHATRLEPEVREAVERRAAAVLPPRTTRESVALAALGPIVLELLPGPDGLTDDEAGAVVQTTLQIGTDAAVARLAGFSRHPSFVVREHLALRWPDVDPARYMAEVLAQLPVESGSCLSAQTPEQLRLLRNLPGHPFVWLHGHHAVDDIAAALEGKPLTSVALLWNHRVASVGFLQSFPALGILHLSDVPLVSDLSPLVGLPLHRLRLTDNVGLRDLSGLDALPGLHSLDLVSGAFGDDLNFLPVAAPLTGLHLPPQTRKLTGLDDWPSLRHLGLQRLEHVPGAADWRAVAELPHLAELTLNPAQLRALATHGEALPELETLHATTRRGDADLSDVPRIFPGLRRVTLNAPRISFTDLTPLASLDELREVRVLGEGDTNAERLPEHVAVTVPPISRY